MKHRNRERSTTRRRIAAVGLVAAAAVTTTALTTTAVFQDQKTVTDNLVTTGQVSISVTPTTAVFTIPAMVPGDAMTVPVTVSNPNVAGNATLRYAMKSVTTEDVLASALVFQIKSGVTTCDNANFGASGTSLHNGIFGSMAGTKIIGDAAQGQQATPGGGDRSLAKGASEVLCMQVSLPTTATNSLASKTTTATFTFDAEQTANNP